ncbi:MAG: zf-HC2 domain-containing protein [Gemmatimonadetes bacterium]|nr:zf-HC2 domain-containing protein [Gemmatimonadota bacterium]MYE15199.1 zf-HC2 domain-containing protein [Gemmatimonadota bacterium]MYG22432.1 zf-HC2 domain-containing protein [Gemmatimonadota bacterium]MYJ39861.1 zf-HC2 domain-containing protein [Gemmatimonadota bacterium]
MLELNCRWFFETYSDYRDGGLGIAAQTAVHAHMASCEPCRRYDRVIRTGVSVLREEEAPARRRNVRLIPLRNRAWAMEQRESMALGSAGSGIATLGVALVAVVLGSFAWLPLVGAGSFAAATPEFELAPVVAAAPESPAPTRQTVGFRPTRLSLSMPLVLSEGRSRGFTVPDRLPLRLQREGSADDVIWPPLLVHGSSWFTGPNTPGLAVEVDPD